MTQDMGRVVRHYVSQNEHARLGHGVGILESERSKQIIARYTAGAELRIADIGGAAGHYSLWLAAQGHQVSLVDLVPKHIETALLEAANTGVHLVDARVADARATGLEPGTFDLVLLMGPLYHLQDRGERIACLQECRRLLKPNGLLLVAAISKFASLMAGYQMGTMDDPEYLAIVAQDLVSGVHTNPTAKDYFTDAFFHTADALEAEIAAAGFTVEKTMAVEGFLWLTDPEGNLCRDEVQLARALDYLSRIETERTLIGASAHWLCAARKGL